MKFLLVIASVVALAVAGPAHRGIITPEGAGPVPAPEPIAVGPAIMDYEPIAVGPAILDYEPISVGPAIIESKPVTNPIVQIILNINGETQIIEAPITSPVVDPVVESVVDPVHVVDVAPEPVDIVDVAPVAVGTPQLPEVGVEPVVIGTPVLPSPAVVLPEPLN